MWPGSFTSTIPGPEFLRKLKEKFPHGTKKTLFTKVIKTVDSIFSTVAKVTITAVRTVATPVAKLAAGAWSAWGWVASVSGRAAAWLIGTITTSSTAGQIAAWLTEGWVKWFPVSALASWVGGRAIWRAASRARIGVAASVAMLPTSVVGNTADAILSTWYGQAAQGFASLGSYLFHGFASTRGF